MAASSAVPDTKARRAFLWIAAVALVLALALTGAWYYLAGRLDTAVREAIAAAQRQGVAVTCGRQRVFGYPFRLGLRCDSVGLDAPDRAFSAKGGALRTAAQLYRPNQIVAELVGPLAVSPPDGPPVDVNWSLAQASARFWTAGLDHFALVLDKPVVGLTQPAGASRELARSDHLEVHARRNGGDLDVAVNDTGIKALTPDLLQAPLFDTAADITVNGAADWLSGRLPGATLGEALAGRSGTIRSLRIGLAGTSAASADVSGPFEVNDKGFISGDFTLAVTDPQAIARLVAGIDPQAAGIANSVASGIAFAGTSSNGRTVIRISVAKGKASIGVIPLGRIPRLR